MWLLLIDLAAVFNGGITNAASLSQMVFSERAENGNFFHPAWRLFNCREDAQAAASTAEQYRLAVRNKELSPERAMRLVDRLLKPQCPASR